MGFLDNLRNFFSRSNKKEQAQPEDNFKKSSLATQIVNLVDKINRINSFDGSIRGLTNVRSYELERRSLAELEQLKGTLENRLNLLDLTKQPGEKNAEREALERSRWTGEKTQNMTDHDLDVYQRSDDI